MANLIIVATQVGVLFALMAVGFACRKLKLLDDAAVKGLVNVLVSNGLATEAVLDQVAPLIDAANIDLKSMDPVFYRDNCGGNLDAVLAAIRQYHATGGHLELTTLVIPGKNDSEEEIEKVFDFAETLNDRGVILHFSRFFPFYLMRGIPPTPPETLYRIRKQGEARGFQVRLGNL